MANYSDIDYHNAGLDFKNMQEPGQGRLDKNMRPVLIWLMRFYRLFIALLAAVSIFLPAGPAAAKAHKHIRHPRNRLPVVMVVEGPHLALKTWQEKRFANKTVVFLGSGLGIIPYNDKAVASILKRMRAGRWGGLLEKEYPTSKFYPVGPSTYLYLAWKAGMVKKVYWVPPTKGSIGKGIIYDPMAFIGGLGFNKDSAKDVKMTGTSVEAKLNGVPVCICGLKDLPALRNVVVVIDLSFFPPLYKDEIKTPFLDLFRGFMATLKARRLKASYVFISNSTGMKLVPMEFRFVAGYLKTFFREPWKLKDGPLPEWEFRSRGMEYNTFFQPDDMLRNYKQAVKHSPGDASLRFDLSKAYLYVKNAAEIRKNLDEAVRIDGGYYLQYIEMGSYFTAQGMPEDAEYFLKKAQESCPDDPRIYEAYSKLYSVWGKYADSIKAYKKIISLGFEDDLIYGGMADSYKKLGQYEKARERYIKALSYIPQVDAKSRSTLLMGLADAYLSDKKPEEAIKTYEEVLKETSDDHARDELQNKINKVKSEWEPFLEPGH